MVRPLGGGPRANGRRSRAHRQPDRVCRGLGRLRADRGTRCRPARRVLPPRTAAVGSGVSRRQVLREVSPGRRFQARAPARLLHRRPRGRARYSVADTGRRAISHVLSTARVDPAMTAWRLLVTEPCDGATNVAIDEALWRGRHAGASPPTVRFFAWDPPTVSVGYGQPLDRHVDVAACRRVCVGLVRRPTGGSATYHDGPERELTYCVTATADDLAVGGDLLETYRWIARALVRGLNTLGAGAEMVPTGRGLGPDPAFCFARTGAFEIEVGGRKLVGSAQRRLGTPFLQHGAVGLSRGRVLLVRRGKPPGEGRWSLPGGLVDLGETSVDAARREVEEECGIAVRIAGLAGVLDRVTRDAGGRVRYHWVLVDYLAFPESDDDTIIAGDVAAVVRWVPIYEVDRMLTTDGHMGMIRRDAVVAPGDGRLRS